MRQPINSDIMETSDEKSHLSSTSTPPPILTKSLFSSAQHKLHNDPQLQVAIISGRKISPNNIDELFKQARKEVRARQPLTVLPNLSLKRTLADDSCIATDAEDSLQ